jgi:guanylate kinase
MGRFIILSGPSCVGKGPLVAALERLYPEIAAGLAKLVLWNSRAPRPIETDGVDYHFRARAEIEALRGREDFIVMEARGDLQAVDLAELARTLANGDAFFEGNPFVARALMEWPAPEGTERSNVYLAPLSRDEIVYLESPERGVSLADFVTEVMRRKLRKRTVRQKVTLTPDDREEIERRAASAYAELKEAHRFDWVIPNHDGEDSANWNVFGHTIGDAFRTLAAFVDLASGRLPPIAEKWKPGLVP